jgi:hypothetical protein
MTAVELREWMLFAVDEPFGDIRADIRSGIVAATIAAHVGKRRNVSMLDFMPFVKRAHDKVADTGVAVAQRFHTEFRKAAGHLPMHVIRARRK